MNFSSRMDDYLMMIKSTRLVLALPLILSLSSSSVFAGNGDNLTSYESIATRLIESGLQHLEAFKMLEELTEQAPHRLSGSKGAEVAVELTRKMMAGRGFDNVHLEKVRVPHWVRGPVEKVSMLVGGRSTTLSACALGGSVGTPKGGLRADVLEVQSFDELKALGDKAHGKIIFFNRGMDPRKVNTFEAYGGAVDQRGRGAIEAAKVGAIAVLIRSVTSLADDVPHTGSMGYAEGIQKIPAAAISIIAANRLSRALKEEKNVRINLELSCETFPDTESANVVGEIRGTEYPNEIILVGGHLDAWDKGSGAHDDGAGCVQAIEVLNLIRNAGLTPKRTIRAVMFMNEENGVRGGRGYPIAPERVGEKHIAALESDRGGFAPRGFSVDSDSTVLAKVQQWKSLFTRLGVQAFEKGGSGVDIDPLVKTGVPGFGLVVESHRYFDYHHSDNDTIDKVNPRELEFGAIAQALLAYLISEEGL